MPSTPDADLLRGTPAAGAGFFPGTQILPEPPPMPATVWGAPLPIYGDRPPRARVVPPGFVPSPANGARAKPVPIAPGSPIITFPGSAMRATIPDIRPGFFDVWTGGAWFARERKMRFRPGGGHGGGNDVTIHEVDADSFAARRCFGAIPTPVLVDKDHNDRAPQPPFLQSVHNYGTECAVRDPLTKRDAFFAIGTAADAMLFDAESGWYELLERVLGQNTTSGCAAGDDKRGCVWLQTSGPSFDLLRYDLASRRIFRHGAGGVPEGWTGGPCGITDDDCLWFLIPGATPDHAFVSILPIARIEADPFVARTWRRIDGWAIAQDFSAAYDAKGERWIVHATNPATWQDGGWWTLDRKTLKVAAIATGGPKPQWHGTFGRLAIDTARDCAITVADSTTDWYGLRLPR